MNEPAAPLVPKRRLFRFGLRTLFVVVTLFCTWLGWNAHVVQQRKQLRKWVTQDCEGQAWTVDAFMSEPAFNHIVAAGFEAPQVSYIRRWLGDEAIVEFSVPTPAYDPQLVAGLEKWFPEAVVLRPPEPIYTDSPTSDRPESAAPFNAPDSMRPPWKSLPPLEAIER